MGKDKSPGGGWSEFFQELLRFDIYKRKQGTIVRQFTCLAMWVVVALAAWRMWTYLLAMLDEEWTALAYGIPTVVLFLGLWLGYRIVNLPSFADFLIAVEAEMNKVSWPSRTELVRSSIVVIVLMFGLTLVLFAYDNIWAWLLSQVLRVTVV